VPVCEEPRHHLLFDNDLVQILDVQIQPGDTTLYHTHDAPIFYVSVAVSPTDEQVLGGEWGGVTASDDPVWEPGEVACNIDYANQPVTHRVRNVGNNLFRLIAIINKRNRPLDQSRRDDINLLGEIEIDNRWFLQSRVTIDPGDSIKWQRSDSQTIIVQASQGKLLYFLQPDNRKAMVSVGDFTVVDPEQSCEISNQGSEPADIVIIKLD
jgi:quercetin dioxygenase-like cupin family protein